MKKGWFRFGVVTTALWAIALLAYALYEWQAPFYSKHVFFRVIPHPELAGVSEAIRVTTPFLVERFIASIVIPAICLWALLLAGPAVAWVRRGFKAQQAVQRDGPASGGAAR